MADKAGVIEVQGTVEECLPSTMFRVRLDKRPPGPGPHLGQDAEALHQDPDRRSRDRRVVAVRSYARQNHLPVQELTTSVTT